MKGKRKPKVTKLKSGVRKVSTKRGSNTIHLKGTTKKMVNPDAIPKSTIKYYLQKNKQPDGSTKEPRAIVLIIKLHRPGNKMKTVSIVSPPDFVVNDKNITEFIADKLSNLEDTLLEMSETYGYEDDFDTERITDYSLKFIY